MIAVDTNLLIYAHREESDWHHEALSALTRLAAGPRRWAIPWPCLHEFLAIATHPSVFRPPTPLSIALATMQAWLGSPSCSLLGEDPGYFPLLRDLLVKTKTVGPRIHDARIAAICLLNGVTELWSADRDFSRFHDLKVVNPILRR